MAEKFDFSSATFETIQTLVFPLVATLFDFDPGEYVADKAILFQKVGEGFDEIAGLFFIAAQALEDGVLQAEEIDEIISKAGSIVEAVNEIGGAFDDAFGGEDPEA